MANMNAQRAKYYGYHKMVDSFFFTSDDQAFLPGHENLANAHAGSLKERRVDLVTRAEAIEWLKEYVPARTKECSDALDAATKEADEANAVFEGLPKTAPVAKRGAALKAAAEAEKRRALCEADLNEVSAYAELLPDANAGNAANAGGAPAAPDAPDAAAGNEAGATAAKAKKGK